MNPLQKKTYEFLKKIPKGKVVTYLDIALALGDRHLCRAIGNWLHQNQNPDEYPCYKVVNAKGELAVHFAFGGLSGQKERLQKDGVEVRDNKVDLKKYRWKIE